MPLPVGTSCTSSFCSPLNPDSMSWSTDWLQRKCPVALHGISTSISFPLSRVFSDVHDVLVLVAVSPTCQWFVCGSFCQIGSVRNITFIRSRRAARWLMRLLTVTLEWRLPFTLREEMTAFLRLAEGILSSTASALGRVEIEALCDTMRRSYVLALAESAYLGKIICPE